MKKLFIFLLCLFCCAQGYATPVTCANSYSESPINPTKDTHLVFNGKSFDMLRGGKTNIHLPYAFATTQYDHLLQVDNTHSYVCMVEPSGCQSEDVVGIVNQGKLVNFYECKIHYVSGGYGPGAYSPSSSGWFKLEANKTKKIKQCPVSNAFPIISLPENHGGKAYYYIKDGFDIEYSYEAGNNVFRWDQNLFCYYYYCDDGYVYDSSKKTCVVEGTTIVTPVTDPQKRQQIIQETRADIKQLEDYINSLGNELTTEQKQQFLQEIAELKKELESKAKNND